MPPPLVVSIPPAISTLDELPIVRVPAPTFRVPDARFSNLVTVMFAAVAMVAPNDVSLLVTIGPVNVKPDVSPNTRLSAEMVPAPANVPEMIESVVPGNAVSLPNTVKEDVPEKDSLLVIVTTNPAGMTTISVDNKAPGADPPHVDPVLKLPDALAVYVVALAALPLRARHNTIKHFLLKPVVKFLIVCFGFGCKLNMSAFFMLDVLTLYKSCLLIYPKC